MSDFTVEFNGLTGEIDIADGSMVRFGRVTVERLSNRNFRLHNAIRKAPIGNKFF